MQKVITRSPKPRVGAAAALAAADVQIYCVHRRRLRHTFTPTEATLQARALIRVCDELRAVERRYVLMLSHWGDQAGWGWGWEVERGRREEFIVYREGFALGGQ